MDSSHFKADPGTDGKSGPRHVWCHRREGAGGVDSSNPALGRKLRLSVSWRMNGRTFALLWAALIFLWYQDVLLGQFSFFYRDFGLFGYPLAHFHRESFWRGEAPLWNPYNYGGLPFLAQWNTLACYPLSLIYLLLPLPWSLNFFCLFHLWLAGVGMFILARRWTGNNWAGAVAGIGYGCCGLMQHALMWPNNMAGLAWMPFVILLVHEGIQRGGRHLLGAMLVTAVQFLAGAPEVFVLTWIIVVCLWVGVRLFDTAGGRGAQELVSRDSIQSKARFGCRWSDWKAWGLRWTCLAGGLLALTAVQWVPLADLLARSHRSADFGTGEWSMPLWGVANFLVPLFHCTPSLAGVYSQDDQQWTASYYMGIGLVWLALCGAAAWRNPRVMVPGVLSMGALVMAFGDGTLISAWLHRLLPFLGFIRFPIKFVIVITWALPMLAAFGAASILERDSQGKPRGAGKAGWFWAAVLATGITGAMWYARHWPAPGEAWEVTWKSAWTRLLLLAGVVGICALICRTREARLSWALPWALAAMLLLDAKTHMPTPNPTVAARALEVVEKEPPKSGSATDRLMPNLSLGQGRAMISPRMAAFLESAGNPEPETVVSGHRRSLFHNWNLLGGQPTMNGFYSLQLKETRVLWEQLYRGWASGDSKRLADFLGIRFVSSDDELFAWEARQGAAPLVTIGQKPVVAAPEEILQRLANGEADLSSRVYLEEPPSLEPISSTPGEAKILETRWKHNRIEVDYESSESAMMIVAQSFSPHWRAETGGERLPVYRANYAFQAVTVPGGRHRLTLRYHDRGFLFGGSLSLLSWIGLGVAGWRVWVRRQPELLAAR